MTKEQATREALRMALEALNHYEKAGLATVKTIDAITAIKEALAQPEHTSEYKRGYADAMNWKVQNHLEHLPTAQLEQEPTPTPNEGFEGSIRIFLKKSDGQWERLEKLEQVHEYNKQQWTQRTAAVGEDTRRAWVGLTDEEAEAVNFPNPGVCYVYPSDWEEVGLPFVRAIEAKLKAKNERLEKNK